MKLYEGMYILDPLLKEDELKALISEIEEEIKKQKGEILETRNVGKKRLAYSINKQPDGYYLVIYFKIDPPKIDNLTQKYRLKERLFRTMLLATTEELKQETNIYLEALSSSRPESTGSYGSESRGSYRSDRDRSESTSAPRPE